MAQSLPLTKPPRPDAVVVLVPGLGLDERAWVAVRDRLAGPSIVVTLPSMGRRVEDQTDVDVERQSQG